MSVYALHACRAGLLQPEEDTRACWELQVVVSCYVGAGNQTPGPLKEQTVPVPTELPLHPQAIVIFTNMGCDYKVAGHFP